MKLYKLLPFALAALVFAACSKDSIEPGTDPGNQTNPDENWEANVEGLTINFTTLPPPPGTRAYSGVTASEGTEGTIYTAYVFAREANPGHARPLTGDWTVIECKVTNGVVSGTGSEVDNTQNPPVTTLKNVATFNGVRQGDYVYVIANDPTMTMAKAESLAHQGMQSEEAIKTYTTTLSKYYLGSLTNRGKKAIDDSKTEEEQKKEMPSGRFIMAGKAMIPVAPTLPSNGTVELAIGLDRELAKVDFRAQVTTDAAQAAYQRVVFKPGDGMVVARIATKTSMFTEREANFYVPSPTCTENWPVNDHAYDADNKPIGFSDHTLLGSSIFDGEATAPIDWNGLSIPANFNKTNTPGEIQEYRYAWVLPEPSGKTTSDGKKMYGNEGDDLIYGNENALYSPIFYTTPNYSNNTNAITVICTQATYIGKDELKFGDFHQAIDAVLSSPKPYFEFKLGDGDAVQIENPLWPKDDSDPEVRIQELIKNLKTLLDLDNTERAAGKSLGLRYIPISKDEVDEDGNLIEAAFDDILREHGIDPDKQYTAGQLLDPNYLPNALYTIDGPTKLTREHYDLLMDRFYAAVILQYRLNHKGSEPLEGTYDATANEDALKKSNRIPNNITAYYYDPALENEEMLPTDELLFGTQEYTIKDGKSEKEYPVSFYTYLSTDDTKTDITDINTALANGKDARLKYFASSEAFNYYPGMKLYYRADIANYVGNTSNRITERNMYYQSTGTIQTLGAKTMHDAIYSEENTMKVDVTVNSWKLSINNIPM